MRAIWNGVTVAEGKETQVVDGYTYFPPTAIATNALVPSKHTTVCGWKGTASYFDVHASGRVNENAAWTYASPKPEAQHIAGWIAFWKGVEIVDA